MTQIRGKGKPKTFTPLPEGEQTLHVFDVKAIPRDNPTVVTMKMTDANGNGFDKYPQKYDLDTDGGYAAFYYFMLNGYGIDISDPDVVVDLDELEDTYVVVDIIHKEGTKPRDDGTYPVFVNIRATVGPGEPFETAEGDEEDEDY